MNNVNQTLYIPLYGKAYVSQQGIILHDAKAEEIWAAEGFALQGKSKSKWLAYYMGMRSAVFDRWLREQMGQHEDAIVLHIGCGLDSRIERVGTTHHAWYDVDFPEVIRERKRYYQENNLYHMIGSDVRDGQWIQTLPAGKNAIVVMEGVCMYLEPEELKQLLKRLGDHFARVHMLLDCYTILAAKASKYKNPINDVGVTVVYGMDKPEILEENTGMNFVKEHEMTPDAMVDELKGMERIIFRKIFGGSISKCMYRLYEYAEAKL
ncbi:MAG: class I SAM-dependent methyltransferase [Lachnospiraceae bacterium]|nr:class I SAM-dependent methyltransferase [Lachnospiraceae bacterium]